MTIFVELNERQIEELTNIGETAMGYQIVHARLNDGTILRNRLVQNATHFEYKTESDFFDVDQIESFTLSEQ